MAKYLNPKADLTFKKIFGEHPNLVISLLNALLPLKDDERVESIEYWPAEKIPRRTRLKKIASSMFVAATTRSVNSSLRCR